MPREHRVADAIKTTLTYASLIVACLIAAIPLVVIVMASLKTTAEFNAGPVLAPPGNWLNIDNFVTAFVRGNMLTAFINTTFMLVVSVVGTVLIGTMAAYAIDRFEFHGRRIVIFLFLLAAIVPGITTQVATFQIVNQLELFNTRWSAIALFIGTDIVSIYIFIQFMRGIPRALDEAALMDGASHFRIYRSIILPLLTPAIVTVVIIKGVAIYNEFYIPFLYMPSPDLGVVATTLFRFKGPYQTQWEVIAAGVVITIIPTLILFLALQRWVYRGFTRGAVR
jgi:ABC-type glycerol-3-phosphate transport system permease component